MRYAIAILLIALTGCTTVNTITIDRQFHACLKADRAPSYSVSEEQTTVECK